LEAPDFSLLATDGKTYSLGDLLDKKALVLVFTCNHCPYAQAAWPLLIELYYQFRDTARFVAINSNDETTYPEDSFEAMKEKTEEWLIPFPYLRDESQDVARAYEAQCTPDVYAFRTESEKASLFYRGRIDDNWQEPQNATTHDLQDALRSLLSGSDAPTQQYPSTGCSIKWKE